MTKILQLAVFKKFFDEICEGKKKIEYRDITPYWTKRLFSEDGQPQNFKVVVFRNGYSNKVPRVAVECLGIEKTDGHYNIRLGNVLEKINM